MVRPKLMITATLVFLTLALPAFAQVPRGPAGPPPSDQSVQGPRGDMQEAPWWGRFHHRDRAEQWAQKLGLTDDQKKKMRLLSVGFQDRTRQARMSLISLKDEKRTMLMSGKVDLQKIAQMDEQKVKLVSEVMTERLKMRRDRIALLTPEQVDKLGELVAKKGSHSRFKKMHRGGGMGDFSGGRF